METNSTESQTLIDRLFQAGAHFGFTKSRRHPTVRPHIYGTKERSDIIDLMLSAEQLVRAREALSAAANTGKTILMVATKEEASTLARIRAERAELPYVTNRWIGGMLTNFQEIKKRCARLTELREEEASGELERKYTKRERVMIGREIAKLEYNFGGIESLERTPDMLLVVDPRHESIAIAEANECGIPVVAIAGTDNDISIVTYPVVVNDTLQASVTLVLDELIGTVIDARAREGGPTTDKK